MSNEPERSLAARAKAGDHDAFEELVGRYHAAVFRLAHRMLSGVDEAEGVTQAAFVKAYEKLGDYDPSRRFFSWVYRIAVNESIDRLGRRKRQVTLDSGIVSSAPSPEEDREQRETVERVDRAVRALPPDLRVVVHLRHFEDLSYREMGEILGIPEKTVKSRLYTARRRLAGMLEENQVRKAANG